MRYSNNLSKQMSDVSRKNIKSLIQFLKQLGWTAEIILKLIEYIVD